MLRVSFYLAFISVVNFEFAASAAGGRWVRCACGKWLRQMVPKSTHTSVQQDACLVFFPLGVVGRGAPGVL